MKVAEGAYFASCSDLRIVIHRIYYSNDEYMKCKIQLFNRYNGIDYGTTKEKIYFKNIGHWTQFCVF